jgi:exodeoxyribonuclease V gamma subunit
VIAETFATAERIVAHARNELGEGVATAADVRLTLPDGRALTGTASGLRDAAVQTTTFARVSPRHRLTAWVRLLALTIAHPEHEWRAVTIGRGEGDAIAVVSIPPLDRTDALDHVAALVELHDRALREPLPMTLKASAAYAQAQIRGDDGRRAACRRWEGNYNFAGEDQDAEHVLAFGGQRVFDDLVGEPPRDDERGPGWDVAEPSRFGRLAMRLWTPLLGIEERREL